MEVKVPVPKKVFRVHFSTIEVIKKLNTINQNRIFPKSTKHFSFFFKAPINIFSKREMENFQILI